ncbi:TadE/TadG family type IV pilus assembly protein [Pyxidicoccus xibeiensis]|uniref:TadE/TadG family type IV pilus assembly protein n=1 Tax=Pyxidicoccus xibeiensis TaxID=2906759 RepID=UPI0020A7D841|nr:TadE/TadG family type IV pilus assembly protein [Pyxidicoccus xibeiensis]MCP3145307.1 pilus assembly protein [Pyxidicoccus xibeiensis]
MRARRHVRLRPSRGAATVEFALAVPLLVMILMFSMYLTELVRAKLKLQEMARYAVWEMTSYTLSDFANGNHDAAFEDARQEAHRELIERYTDMDSVEPNAPAGTFIARYSSVAGTITNKEIPFLESGMLSRPSTSEGGSFAGGILGALNSGAGALLNGWGFNNKGWVESEVTMNFDNVIIPRSYLDENSGPGGFFQTDTFGGQDLASVPLRSRFSMYANGWHMPDGGDAVIDGRRAGNHRSGGTPHGLYQQVGRMKFLGLGNVLNSLGIGGILDAVATVIPNFFGTFVVARNYGITPDQKGDCNGLNKYDSRASSGLHAMRGLLDHDRPDCFDTAPFRDEMTYEHSNYIRVFEARGEFFMGCKRAMADDPSDPDVQQESTERDEQDDKVRCE